MAARSLAGSRSFIIGLLFDNPSPSYTMNILGGVYDACARIAATLLLDRSSPADKPETRILGFELIQRDSVGSPSGA